MVKVNSRTIQRLLQGHGQFIREADEARRYYSNVNRIKQDNSVLQRQAETEQALGNPLHLADNRISHSWHNLLVTQKVSYALSYPPVFDVGNKTANERIAEILGDQYTATAMQLGIDASNTSVGWLHYWRGTDGRFRYHTVDPEQIVPVFSGTLESDLVGVLRCYTMLDPAERSDRAGVRILGRHDLPVLPSERRVRQLHLLRISGSRAGAAARPRRGAVHPVLQQRRPAG